MVGLHWADDIVLFTPQCAERWMLDFKLLSVCDTNFNSGHAIYLLFMFSALPSFFLWKKANALILKVKDEVSKNNRALLSIHQLETRQQINEASDCVCPLAVN